METVRSSLDACREASSAEPIAAVVLAVLLFGGVFGGHRIVPWVDLLVRAVADRLRGRPDTGAGA